MTDVHIPECFLVAHRSPTSRPFGRRRAARRGTCRCRLRRQSVRYVDTRDCQRTSSSEPLGEPLPSAITQLVAVIGPFPYGGNAGLSELEAAITRSDSFASEEQDHGLVPRLRASASTLHSCMAADMSDVAGTDRSQKLLHRAPDAHSLSFLCQSPCVRPDPPRTLVQCDTDEH